MIVHIPGVLTFKLEDFIRVERRHERNRLAGEEKRLFGIVKERKILPDLGFQVVIVLKGDAPGTLRTHTISWETFGRATEEFDRISGVILAAQAQDKAEREAAEKAGKMGKR